MSKAPSAIVLIISSQSDIPGIEPEGVVIDMVDNI